MLLKQLERGTMPESKSTTHGGVGFLGLLTILFIALKLTGYINWSWWWILAPSWIPLSIALVVILFCVAMGTLSWALDKFSR